MKLLDGLLQRRFIYIHAPAGFGKTASSLLWLEHREKRTDTKHAWIGLDEHDNQMAGFCRRFVVVLSGLQPENTALRELATQTAFSISPVEFILHALSVFAEKQEPHIFVLDDVHKIKNPKILEMMPIMLKRLPKNCTVLLLSRSLPPDSFDEMLAKGELAIANADCLQFTSNEIKVFFDKNGRTITNRQADEIFASTGGWAIGISAMLLSDETSYSTDLTEKYLVNFLNTHVWERWDGRLKRFMALVSVAEELTPELCDWLIAGDKLLKRTSSEEMLSELMHENAFIRKTDRDAYRFHDLFRDFLLDESGEHLSTAQYNKAGEYHFDKNDYFRALENFLKGKNDDGVAKSLYCMYDYKSLAASIEDTLYTISISVTDSLVEKHPFLLEVQTWTAYAEGCADDFENYLDRYYALFPKILTQNPRSAIIRMILPALDYRQDFIDVCKAIRLVPFKGNIKVYSPSFTNNMPFFHRSVRDFSDLDLDKDMPLIEKTFGVVIGVEWAVIKECVLAGAHYERRNLEEALKHALAACANIPDGCAAELKFCAMMILASTLAAIGQDKDAGEILGNAKDMIDLDNAFYLKPNLQAYLCRLKLANGDMDAARDWLKNHKATFDDSLPIFKVYQYYTTARAHIALGEYTVAALLLQKLLALGESYRRPLDIIEAHILLAIAHWKIAKGSLPIAIEHLEQGAALAQNYGYTQIFANEGSELVNMLHRLQKRAVQKDYAGGVSSEFAKTLYVSAVSESKHTKGLTGGRITRNLTFTDKQKTVMGLMCKGYSRKGIAEQMGIKPNGVKAHIELIYNKLDVANNVDAIMKIEELGLLAEK